MSTTNTAPLIGAYGEYAGKPYSGSFIPTLWSAKILEAFYEETFLSEITNTDYEGEIKSYGDSVRIIKEPSVAVHQYALGTGLVNHVVTPDNVELNINRAVAFSTPVNSVLQAQALPNLTSMYSAAAARAMKEWVQQDVLVGHTAETVNGYTLPARNGVWNDVAAANQGAAAGATSGALSLGTAAAPISVTASSIVPLFLALSSALDEQNVPSDGRFLLMDTATRMAFLQSPIADAGYSGDAKTIQRTGEIGVFDRFRLFVTNALPRAAAGLDYLGATAAGTAAHRTLIAGHKSAISFAGQVDFTDHLKNPTDFGDILRGAQVFGYKVLRPEALALARIA
jgi:hypothetical protein